MPILTCTPQTTTTSTSISEKSSEVASPVTPVSDEDFNPQDKTNAALVHLTAPGKTSGTQAGSAHAQDADLQDTDETQVEPSNGPEEPKFVEEDQYAAKSDVREHVSRSESIVNGNVVDHEDALPDPSSVHEPTALSPVSSSGHAGIPWAELSADIQTTDPTSGDDLQVSEEVAQDLFTPNTEGEDLDPIFPFLTKQPASLTSEDNSQDSTLLLKSQNVGMEKSAVQVVEEPGLVPFTDSSVPTPATAEMSLLQNIEVPDMGWASDSPVAFTSSAPNFSVDKKIDELRARAEAAFLRRHILRQHAVRRGQQVEEEQAACTPAPPTPSVQEKEGAQVPPKSGKMSNRKKQRQAAKAKRNACLESSVTAVVTPNLPAPSSTIVSTPSIGSQHADKENYNSMEDEFMVEAKPSKRSQRARAYAESKEKKAEEQKAARELKKVQEEEDAAKLAAVPVLTAAAKRRNRQKRRDEGKSWADVLKS